MTALAGADFCGGVKHQRCCERAVRRLLPVGIGTMAVYRVGNLLSPLLHEGFIFRDQAFSGGNIASKDPLELLPWIST